MLNPDDRTKALVREALVRRVNLCPNLHERLRRRVLGRGLILTLAQHARDLACESEELRAWVILDDDLTLDIQNRYLKARFGRAVIPSKPGRAKR